MIDQRGIGVTVYAMLLAIFLLLTVFWTTNLSQTIFKYDSSLQSGVAVAVRNASLMIEKESLAEGKPIINHLQAHAVFQEVLDKSIPHGTIGNYVLAIYNHDYDANGVIYCFKNGELVNTTSAGMQVTFYISDEDVNTVAGDVSATFTEPGCVGLVKLNTDSFAHDEFETGLRWAASTIISGKDIK